MGESGHGEKHTKDAYPTTELFKTQKSKSKHTGHAGAATEACALACWLAGGMGESGHGEKHTKDTYPTTELFKN